MQRLLKGIYFYIGLGLITLFLVTMVVPAIANPPILIPISKTIATHRSPRLRVSASPRQSSVANLNENSITASSPIVQHRQQTWAKLAQGRDLYQAGRFAQAAQVWREAVRDWEQQGDELHQAGGLSYLALAYQALGQWQQAQNAIETSLAILQKPEHAGEVAILAQALNTQGQLENGMGHTEVALKSWQQAEVAYQAANDEQGVLGSQINQAQALQTLGWHRRATAMLGKVNEHLQAQPDSLLKFKGLHSLGTALQVVGNFKQSQEVLEQSLTVAEKLQPVVDKGVVLFTLGNTMKGLAQPDLALDYYQQAERVTTSSQVKLEAQLNQLSLQRKLGNEEAVVVLIPTIERGLQELQASRAAVYAAVNFAENLAKVPEVNNNLHRAAKILARAVQQSRNLQDPRSQAYALNQLGQVYAQTQQQQEALQLTQQAWQIAQNIQAPEIAYRASWQLGKLLKEQGNAPEALAAYKSAFQTLQSLRSDLVAVNTDIQFEFTESIEPVYRELVALLLAPENNRNNTKGIVEQDNLKEARQVIEALQIAELDNFFQEACLKTQPKQIDEIDAQAAVIYPIILPERLEVIVSLPGKPLINYATVLPQQEIKTALRRMRQSLNPAFANQERLRLYQKAYDWLIRPAEAQLDSSDIKTMVFVLDGELRNLPMAALYDGKQYLVEKYSVALSQGLQLLESQSLQSGQIEAITAGLSEAREGFRALPEVESELSQISSEIATKVLLNQEFTDDSLQNAVDSTPFPVIHLATHGQFSSHAEDTFILTWNGRINVKKFDQLLRSRQDTFSKPIELLVLSACQTAKGDNRATLGLAGMAVRSGARSTLATLWAVRDKSTAQLMSDFYKQLRQPGMSKSEALRQAQIHLLQGEYKHPVFWAPFVLVGNWT